MTFRSFQTALRESPLLGFCSSYATPGIIERIGQHWDWCWIDGQHGEWSLHDLVQGVRACNLAGIFSMVRVPGQDPGTLGKALDTACHAVMVPMVENADQAAALVRAGKFAPLGRRSYGGRRPIDLFSRAYADADQPQPMLVCQIESPEALEQVEAIAAVDGVDALFFGPDDMALALGMPMDKPRPAGFFDEAMARIAQAAARHGKTAAGIFATPESLRQGLDLGYRMLIGTSDVSLLAPASQAAARNLRAVPGAPARGACGPAPLG